MTGRRTFSVLVLIAGAAATAIGFVMPFVGSAGVPYGKGGSGSNPFGYYLPSILVLAGIGGLLVGGLGIALSHPPRRRLAVASVVCGGLALLLEVPWVPWPAPGVGYSGIWLGGLLSLVAIATAVGAFTRPMHKKAFETALGVLGLMTGIPSALFAGWVLLLTISGGVGD